MNNTNESVLRAATFNIRFDTHPPASITTKGEAPWNVRKVKIADTILFHRIDLVGIQVRRIIMLNFVSFSGIFLSFFL
jgi:hypothetical protein